MDGMKDAMNRNEEKMILQAFIFKYPGFSRIELFCENFDKSFTHQMYLSGWRYDHLAGKIFFKTFTD